MRSSRSASRLGLAFATEHLLKPARRRGSELGRPLQTPGTPPGVPPHWISRSARRQEVSASSRHFAYVASDACPVRPRQRRLQSTPHNELHHKRQTEWHPPRVSR